MIAWLQPAALWGLALLAVPIVIHLLRPRHAQRVRFPCVRFVQPSRTAAVRFRQPSDLVLLAIRLAIVALASLAAAQPIWLSPDRLSAWNARTARAIVMDSSESMRTPLGDNRTASDEARAAAEAEAGSVPTILIEHADLREGLQRAVAWLESAPPARREIVVISDFQHGALPAASVETIDSATGLRFVRVGGGMAGRSLDGIPLLQVPGVDGRAQKVEVTPDATELRLERRTDAPAAARGSPPGLRFVGAEAEGERLLAALARAGTPAPNPERPMAIVFTTGAPAGGASSFEPWMIETVARVERDAELRALAREASGVDETSDGWTLVLTDRGGRPLVSAAVANQELLLHCAAPPASYFSAALVRTALEGSYGPVVRPELEVLATTETTLFAWTRPAGPVDASVWRRADESDARWLWAAALVFLAVESVLRSRTSARKEEARAAAA